MKWLFLSFLFFSLTKCHESGDLVDDYHSHSLEKPGTSEEDHDGSFHRHSELLHNENDEIENEHHHQHKIEKINLIKNNKNTWMNAIGSVIGISLLPCVLLFFIPAKNANGSFLKILLAFGAGGLLGDALLHIIPHSLHPHGKHEHQHHHHHHHKHEHEHEHENEHKHDHANELKIGVYVIIGILVFMLVEQFVRIFKNGHCHSHQIHDHGSLLKAGKEDHRTNKNEANNKLENIKATAYLNLVADFVHNFTDGLAIGASYTSGNYIGFVTTLTVLLHELPHEIGDFAILVQSGFSKWKAIQIQLITAIGAIFGCLVSLLVSNPDKLASDATSSWIMPFTAGGFIYIATVSVISELLDNEGMENESKCKKMLKSIFYTFAIVVGAGMMYCVSFFE